MSILQDALKRKDVETTRPGGLPPPPLPPAEEPRSHHGKSGTFLVMGLALLLVGAGLYKVWNDRANRAKPPPEETADRSDSPASGPGRVLDQVKSTVKAAQDRVRDGEGNRWPDLPLAYRGAAPVEGARATLYVFWQTTSLPCRESLPKLNELFKNHAAQGFSVVGITSESPDVVNAFLRETPVEYPIAYDPENQIAAELGVRGIPMAFLVESGGRIAWRGNPMKLTGGRLKSVLAPAEATATPEPSARPAAVRPAPAPEEASQVADRVPPTPETRSWRGSEKWPILKVNGIVTHGGKANVILGEDVLGVGEETRGVRVLRIGGNEVTLLFGSEQKTLRTGQTTQPK